MPKGIHIVWMILRKQKAEDLTKTRQTEEEFLARYSFDNVIQSRELANELQHQIIGRKFIDSDNNGRYAVSAIFYDSEFEVVVGKRNLWMESSESMMIVSSVFW